MSEDPLDRIKDLPPEIVAEEKAARDRRQAHIRQRLEEIARLFKARDSVPFAYYTPQGFIDPNSGLFIITKWSDDYGSTIYTQRGSKESNPPEAQIRALSEIIQAQQAAFGSLDPSEQTKIRRESTLPGHKTDERFRDFLNNEALAAQFQRLK